MFCEFSPGSLVQAERNKIAPKTIQEMMRASTLDWSQSNNIFCYILLFCRLFYFVYAYCIFLCFLPFAFRLCLLLHCVFCVPTATVK